MDDHADVGKVRIAGKAGMGDGERPNRVNCEGELGAFEPLKDDRLEEGLSMGGGGNMAADGVLATDVTGVSGALLPPCWLPEMDVDDEKTSSLSLSL